jgi:hypothetical protein
MMTQKPYRAENHSKPPCRVRVTYDSWLPLASMTCHHAFLGAEGQNSVYKSDHYSHTVCGSFFLMRARICFFSVSWSVLSFHILTRLQLQNNKQKQYLQCHIYSVQKRQLSIQAVTLHRKLCLTLLYVIMVAEPFEQP